MRSAAVGKLAVTLVALTALVGIDSGAVTGAKTEDPHMITCILRVENPDPGMGDGFGAAIAIQDDFLFVGAPGDDEAGVDAGAVHVFDAASLAYVGKIRSPDGKAGANFGGTLATTPTRLIVGPDPHMRGPWRATDVHVFSLPDLGYKGGVPAHVPDDKWEHEVHIGASGDIFAVAAKWSDAPTTHGPKAVRVYSAEDLTFRFGLDREHNSERTVDGHPVFGESLFVDDRHVYVGQTHKTATTGTLSVYTRDDGSLVTRLSRPPGSDMLHYGRGIARIGDQLAVGGVGNRPVHVYDLDTWDLVGSIRLPSAADMEFGMRLHAVGPWLAIPNADRDGWGFHNVNPNAALHLFDAQTLRPILRLAPAEPTLGGGFGWAIAANGDRLLVGAFAAEGAVPASGTVYVYAAGAGPAGAPCTHAPDASHILSCGDVDDFDGDGQFRNQELAAGTDPCHPDTDRDGLHDGFEAALGADPLSAHSDEDSLTDGEEMRYGTNPTRRDTDGDHVPDDVELEHGSDPRDPASIPFVPPLGADPLQGARSHG